MGNMKFGIFQNADWGLGGLVRFVDWWDSWDGGIRGMEENKKSGGGDVRAEALSWDGEWDKA